ncbi:uncharacterized protein LOC130982749 isoform X1 [Arachis stenosperma]|uniref:uncharacterized protein LOC130982749 isoform X1 n=1 Tax=Arachis stenosperma TaxID=217475 RepID=UPI0025ACBAD3|nr:uncharacterized protein LOC130982749 isoform X1 [Arachis stenosperma]
METLAIASDSFSYSWLSSNCNNKSPLDGFEESLTKEFINYSVIDSDHLLAERKNFNFDPSITHSPVVLVHADELFSQGILRPVGTLAETHSDDISEVLDSSPNGGGPNSTQTNKLAPSCSLLFPRAVTPRKLGIHHGILAKWRRSTWRTLVYLFRYVNNQLGQKVGCSRIISTRVVDDIDKTDWKFKSLRSSSVKTSPIVDLHHHENSIYEAVLHCKRSVGN